MRNNYDYNISLPPIPTISIQLILIITALFNYLQALSPITSTLLNGGDKIILGTSSELPEYSCDNAPDIPNTAMGTGGVMYLGGNIVSGPQDSLVDLLLPNSIEDLDKEFAFTFLLSSRLFIRPHDLLGRLLLNVPEEEPLDRLVALLSIWTNTFPYDFRDERIMCHVKHIVARCANTGLGDVVSELLSALLNRLTELEQHEKELRACQSLVDETELIKWPSATQLAQILCRIERKLAKHIGPEEFVQCSSTVHISRNKKSESKPSGSGGPGGQDSKKTCNLESYLDWSARLRLLVSNEILLCNGIRDRSKVVELWSGVAQYCLLVGNYNSATVILESLESPAIARLQATWSKLSTTSQQLDCMQRHADGCGDLWIKQTGGNSDGDKQPQQKVAASSIISKTKPNDWVVIPVFADIVRLAVQTREECLTKLPNGHMNVAAFYRLAAVVGAFTRHMSDVNSILTETGEYENVCRHMQNCTLQTDRDLMLASFDCEEPTSQEKQAYHLV
ncbi:ras-GEF domain-containing family member 1B [Bradysia coprophila]|uniref:ras-GEF domain-containing family member 1B n=1 Tax=Bradysia coprophila TaxID=38358 RepID=UPI00187D9337|nr:ras-GEF domain-containing family member 1B [Bradysia coprophila]